MAYDIAAEVNDEIKKNLAAQEAADIQQEIENQRRTDFKSSLTVAAAFEPTKFAQALKVQRESGVPAKVAYDNADQIASLKQEAKFAGLFTAGPRTSEALSKPEHAIVAQGDEENLLRMEKAAEAADFYKQGFFERQIAQPWAKAIAQDSIADLPARMIQLDRISSDFDKIESGEASTSPWAVQYQQADAAGRKQMRDNLNLQRNLAIDKARVAQYDISQMPVDPTERKFAEAEGFAENASALASDPMFLARVAGQAIPGTAEGLAASLINPLFGGAVEGINAGNYKFMEVLQEKGIDPADPIQLMKAIRDDDLMQEANTRAARYGAGVGTVGALSAGLLNRVLAPTKFNGRLLSNRAREGINVLAQIPAQGALEAAGELTGQVAERGQLSDVDAKEVALEGIVGGVMSLPEVGAFGTKRFTTHMVQARRAERAGKLQADLVEKSMQSSTRANDPASFEAIVSTQLAGRPNEYLEIPAAKLQELNQSGQVNIAELLENVGIDPEHYSAQVELGGTITIKNSAYLAYLAEQDEFLRGSIRVAGNEYTLDDVQEIDNQMLAEMEKIASQFDQTDQVATAYSDVMGQLLNAGYERGAADTTARQYAAVMTRLAEQTGQTVEEVMAANPLNIGRDVPAPVQKIREDQLSLMLGRLRAGDIPQPGDMFGKTLTEYLTSAGGIQDIGGELAAFDADVGKRGRNRLTRTDGMTPDDAAMQAWERGYFPGVAREDVTPNLLIDALREEAAGTPRYSVEQENATLRDQAQSLEALQEYLDREGIDLATMSDEDVLQLLRGGERQAQLLPELPAREDGTSSRVADDGLIIVHGSGNADLKLDDIAIVRSSGQKQGKKGRVYGGFYGTSETDAAQAEGYAGMMEGTPTLYDIRVKPGTGVLHKDGDITRLSETYINQLVEQGYGLIIGTDPRGRTEYVVIDKNAIDAIAQRGSLPPMRRATQRLDQSETKQQIEARLEAANPGLKLDLLGSGDRITLSRIELPKEGRQQGSGSKIMADLTAWADANGKTIALTPSADFGGNKKRLVEFYKRFGFIENKGKNRDFEISEAMYRPAVQTLNQSAQTETQAFKRLSTLLGSDSAARDMMTAISQTFVNSLKRDAEAISNFLKSKPFGSEPSGSIDIPSSVVPHVLSVTDNEQVLGAIVRSIPVDVMDFLGRKNLSPERLLRDQSMLEDVLAVNGKSSVSLGINKAIAGSLMGSVADTAAEISNLASRSLKGDSAGLTGANNSVLGAQNGTPSNGLGGIKDITKSKNFLNWFGDSKVVDDAGEPLVVHHGTNAEFNEFRPSKTGSFGKGIYFADSGSDAAAAYGERVVSAYLSLQNPWVINADYESDAVYAEDVDNPAVDAVLTLPGGRKMLDRMKASGGEHFDSELTDSLVAKGYDGIIATYPDGSKEYIAFHPEQIKSAIGNRGTFDPADPNILNQGDEETPRGSITFGPRRDGVRRFDIRLTAKSDLSTVLHEMGHYYLEVIGDLVQAGKANEALSTDYAVIRDWLGAEEGKPLTVDQHEQFARGFEKYLAEGKAPSIELQTAFSRFKRWLVGIYKDLKRLNVDLSPEIRSVFDRLLASQEAIDEAEQALALSQQFSENIQKIMTPEELANYARASQQARDDATDEIEREILKAERRKEQEWYKEQRKAVEAEVRAELEAAPAYQARKYLFSNTPHPQTGKPVKLDTAAVTELFGTKSKQARFLGRARVKTGGMHPETAAFLLGYGNPVEMLTDMMAVDGLSAAVKAETDRRMAERYPDPRTSGELAEKAMAAVGEREAEVQAIQLRALAREAGRKSTQHRIIKEAARQHIARLRLRDAIPYQYQRASAKAARAVEEALLAGNLPKAYEEKERQLMNLHLYREAVKAQDLAEQKRAQAKAYMKAGAKRKRLQEASTENFELAYPDGRIEYAATKAAAKLAEEEGATVTPLFNFLEQVDGLLQKYEFGIPRKAIRQQRETLQKFLAQMAGESIVVNPPEWLLLPRAERTNWKDLTIDQLVDVVDMIRQIDQMAKNKLFILKGDKLAEYEPIRDAIAASIELNGHQAASGAFNRNFKDQIRKWGREWLGFLPADQIARELDGQDDLGPVQEHIVGPVQKAAREAVIREKAEMNSLAELVRQFYGEDDIKGMHDAGKLIAIPEIGQSMTRMQMVMLMANLGNEGNRNALLTEQRGIWTAETIQAVMANLDSNDADFVEALWAWVDKFWPEIAEAEAKRTGVAPAKVQGSPYPVKLADGTVRVLKGGYFPLKYDGEASIKTSQDDVGNAFKNMTAGRTAKAYTPDGHRIERVGSGGRPVKLDFSVLTWHVGNIVRDLTMTDPINQAWRFLHDTTVQGAFERANTKELHTALEIWMQDSAEGEKVDSGYMTASARWLRTGFTANVMLFNLANSLLNLAGTHPLVVLGKRWAMRGYRAAFMPANWKQMYELSSYMREARVESYSKDLALVQDQMAGKGGWRAAMTAAGFYLHNKTQQFMDAVVWMGAYEKGMSLDLVGQALIDYADQRVVEASGSGVFADRSALERGTLSRQTRQNEIVRGLTTLAGYMIRKMAIARRRTAETDFKDVAQAMTWAVDMALLFTLEGLAFAFVKGNVPDEDEDEQAKEWAKTAGWETFASVGSGLPPFGRPVVSAIQGFGGGSTSVDIFSEQFGNAIQQIKQGDADTTALKALVALTGTATKTPGIATNRVIDWLDRAQDGETPPWWELFTGNRNK